jgi:hypothetical protein
MSRASAPPSPEELEALAKQIASRYTPPETGGWSEIGSPFVIRMLLEASATGLKPHDACQSAGISTDTLTRWLKRAETEPDSPYAALAEAIKTARAQGKRWHLENIQRHSLKEWTASAWTLERTDPEQFALRKEDNDAPRVLVQIGVSDSEIKVLVSDGDLKAALSPQNSHQLACGNHT